MYKIVGGDQREYGPVSADILKSWIAQGRVQGSTLVNFEGGPWKPASSFPEFSEALRTASPPPLTVAATGMPGANIYGQKNSSMANAGLALSILGCCCVPFAIGGLVCSIIGLIEIQKNPQLFRTNKWIPITGIILSAVAIIWQVSWIASGGYERVMQNLPR